MRSTRAHRSDIGLTLRIDKRLASTVTRVFEHFQRMEEAWNRTAEKLIMTSLASENDSEDNVGSPDNAKG